MVGLDGLRDLASAIREAPAAIARETQAIEAAFEAGFALGILCVICVLLIWRCITAYNKEGK